MRDVLGVTSVGIIEVRALGRHSSFLGYDNCPSVIGGSDTSDDPGFFGATTSSSRTSTLDVRILQHRRTFELDHGRQYRVPL